MKKIWSIAGAIILSTIMAMGQATNTNTQVYTPGGTQVIQNTPSPTPINSNTNTPVNNPQNANPNKNATYNNNSLQYNKGNALQNNVPTSNGTYDVPGAQGINNNYNLNLNNSNTPGTINNNGVNGTYTQPGTLQK